MFLVCTGPYKMLRKLHKSLTSKSNLDSVLIANAMFSQKGFPMEETFVATNKANFQCESRNLDFSDPRAASDQINGWVKNKTKGKDVLSKNSSCVSGQKNYCKSHST